MSRPTAIERAQQTRRLLRTEGYAGVASRLLDRASHWLTPASGERVRVARADMVRAAEIASAGWKLPPPRPLRDSEPMEIAWNCIPPGEGAGGFTTMFRLASSLEQAGHRCVIYLHDRHGWSLDQHEKTIRAWWPSLQAEIRDGVRRDRGRARDLCHVVGNRVPRPHLSGAGGSLLPGTGLRAVVLRGGQRVSARRGHLPLRLPRRHSRPLAGGAAGARVRHARRPLRIWL